MNPEVVGTLSLLQNLSLDPPSDLESLQEAGARVPTGRPPVLFCTLIREESTAPVGREQNHSGETEQASEDRFTSPVLLAPSDFKIVARSISARPNRKTTRIILSIDTRGIDGTRWERTEPRRRPRTSVGRSVHITGTIGTI